MFDRLVVAVTLAFSAGVGTSPVAQASRHLSAAGQVQGDLEAAERATSAELSAVASTGTPSDEWTRAATHYLRALLANGNGKAPTALTIAARLAETAAAGSPARAQAEVLLGAVLEARAEFRASRAAFERALAIDATGVEAVPALVGLGQVLLKTGDFARAQRIFEKALAAYGTDSRASSVLGAAHLGLGRALRALGEYKRSSDSVSTALAILGTAPEAAADRALALNTHGDLQFLNGDLNRARQTWAESLELGRRVFRRDHPALVRPLLSSAVGAAAFGDYAGARALRQEAIDIAERSLSPCDPDLSAAFSDFAVSASEVAEYATARRWYRRSLQVATRCIGPTAVAAATATYNLYTVAVALGDVPEAGRLGRRAVRMYTASLGADHPFVAFALSELGGFYSSNGQFLAARRALEQSLRVRRSRLGPDHPDVAGTLIELASAAAAERRFEAARAQLDEALTLLGRADPTYAEYRANALMLRARLRSSAADVAGAIGDLRQALSEREQTVGRSHPETVRTLVALGDLLRRDERVDEALALALDAEAARRAGIAATARYLPERLALSYADRLTGGLDLALAIAAGSGAAEPAFDAVIKSRGLVLREMALRARGYAGVSPALVPRLAALTAARQRLAFLAIRESRGESVAPALLRAAEADKERAEEALAEAGGSLDVGSAAPGLSEVVAALPADAALVSFVRFGRDGTGVGQAGAGVGGGESYIAFVARSGAGPRAVMLGSAPRLDARVAAWRRQVGDASAARLSTGERSYRTVAARLKQSVWDPLAPLVGDARGLFVVPDGPLNFIRLAPLPAANGRYLADSGPTFHYLTVERDLLEEPSRARGRGLLAVGGPAYSMRSTGAAAASRAGCRGQALEFGDLPGTRAEVTDIAGLWNREEVRVLTGRSATAAALVRDAPGRQVIHLATHGFFLGEPCGTPVPSARGVGGLTAAAALTVSSPLLLSGLAFAGANDPVVTSGASDDGIMTAEEAVGLNLTGTEWVVLSACDTGVGEVRAGEGVFGLRRAFQVAGARTVIMSLWSVDDQATRVWMRALYEGRLQRGLSTADAVHQASLATLRDRRARGLSTHPFYWAAFVAAGDWR